ncbi:MAG: glycosyltransferase family 4 protein [Armatimonadetes bacterium]|nr:glycosyltransferase family 4 protein [Armatimonadota bacterium]
MRIAQFAESYRPVINGAAVAVDLLSRELVARSHAVEVFAPRFRGHEDDFPVHRFPSYTWPHHPDYPLAIPIAPELRRRFHGQGYEVVHTHSPFVLGQTGMRWARRHGIPLVTTYHTLYVEYSHYAVGVPRRLARSYLRRLSRRYCDRCDAVAVPTEPIREVLLEYGVRRPICVIPTGLRLRPPVPRDPEFPRGRLGIPEAAQVVLFAGRLAREKNLELLFTGFERAAAEASDVYLLIAGEGPESAAARTRAAAGPAAGRIRFAGAVAPEQMGTMYAGADLFAFASLHDTQGLVLTEAKAAGLPAVAVASYGPATVVTDGVDGLLTDPDPVSFGNALLRLLRSPELCASMSRAALTEVRRFSIAATAAAYEELYGQARDEANARRRR